MSINERTCHEGCLFLSGIFSYLSLLKARDIWKEQDEADKQFALYQSLERDEILFYISVSTINQRKLVRWYNQLAAQSDLSDIMCLHADQESVDSSVEFFQAIRRNIEEICTELWADNSQHYLDRWQSFILRPWSYYQSLDPSNQVRIRAWYRMYKIKTDQLDA